MKTKQKNKITELQMLRSAWRVQRAFLYFLFTIPWNKKLSDADVRKMMMHLRIRAEHWGIWDEKCDTITACLDGGQIVFGEGVRHCKGKAAKK